MRERDPRLREDNEKSRRDDAWKGDPRSSRGVAGRRAPAVMCPPKVVSNFRGSHHRGGAGRLALDRSGSFDFALRAPLRMTRSWLQDDTRARLQAGGFFPRQVNQLFLSGIIFIISYPRGLNFISFRVWNFEFCGIFWKRRGWGMSHARRIIFA